MTTKLGPTLSILQNCGLCEHLNFDKCKLLQVKLKVDLHYKVDGKYHITIPDEKCPFLEESTLKFFLQHWKKKNEITNE
jgi:hypothetical protein